jgi:hypothetical protein
MTVRIDFGRLFPGLVILLVGVAFFVLWLLLVFVSFFAFFIPGLSGIFHIALDILIASLVLMGVGALFMAAGVSGWWRGTGVTWGSHRSVADRDRLMPGQRAGEVVSVIISTLVLYFFYENQVRGTGFFTSRFGPTEQALFYGTWLVGVGVSLARAAYGRRNPVRPADAFYGLMLAATALTLLGGVPVRLRPLPRPPALGGEARVLLGQQSGRADRPRSRRGGRLREHAVQLGRLRGLNVEGDELTAFGATSRSRNAKAPRADSKPQLAARSALPPSLPPRSRSTQSSLDGRGPTAGESRQSALRTAGRKGPLDAASLSSVFSGFFPSVYTTKSPIGVRWSNALSRLIPVFFLGELYSFFLVVVISLTMGLAPPAALAHDFL